MIKLRKILKGANEEMIRRKLRSRRRSGGFRPGFSGGRGEGF
jgi:hypothetical protein